MVLKFKDNKTITSSSNINGLVRYCGVSKLSANLKFPFQGEYTLSHMYVLANLCNEGYSTKRYFYQKQLPEGVL